MTYPHNSAEAVEWVRDLHAWMALRPAEPSTDEEFLAWIALRYPEAAEALA